MDRSLEPSLCRPPTRSQIVRATALPFELLRVEFLEPLVCVDVLRPFVVSNPHNPREAKCETARVMRAPLDLVVRDLDHGLGSHMESPALLGRREAAQPLRHRLELRIREALERLPDDREDVQGPHGCGVPGDDGAVARPRDVRGALGIPCATRDRGRGRVQRDPAEPALPERFRTSLRTDCADSRRQRAAGRRHIRAAQGTLREAVRTEGPWPGRSVTWSAADTTRARGSGPYL